MLYIYTPRGSAGARELAETITLQGTLARRTKGQKLTTLQAADLVVCWGSHFAAPAGTRTLNNVPAITKFEEVRRLTAAGVPTVQVSQTRPAGATATARPAFVPATFTPSGQAYTPTTLAALRADIDRFERNETTRRQAWERTPATPAETWLPRRNNHVGGTDLLTPTTNPDFWSKKENITAEYRVHMFNGKSIRAGVKTAVTERDGRRITPHQWIRSFDGGWVIRYDGFESTPDMRELAKRALEALGLNFGAVDIGRKADGTLIVFEVNRAPGIEGNSLTSYATKIIAWANGTDQAPARRGARAVRS